MDTRTQKNTKVSPDEWYTPKWIIDELGPFAVDHLEDGKLSSSYYPTREAAIEGLKQLPEDAALRATTLEDVFVERIGHHLTKG